MSTEDEENKVNSLDTVVYRAWDRRTQTIRHVLLLDWANQLIDLSGGLIDRKPEEVILMQSSPVRDARERRVYAGDVVRQRVHINVLGTDIDEWVEDYYEVKQEEGVWSIGENSLWARAEGGVFSDGFYYAPIEVVGNIYHNPELLSKD